MDDRAGVEAVGDLSALLAVGWGEPSLALTRGLIEGSWVADVRSCCADLRAGVASAGALHAIDAAYRSVPAVDEGGVEAMWRELRARMGTEHRQESIPAMTSQVAAGAGTVFYRELAILTADIVGSGVLWADVTAHGFFKRLRFSVT